MDEELAQALSELGSPTDAATVRLALQRAGLTLVAERRAGAVAGRHLARSRADDL